MSAAIYLLRFPSFGGLATTDAEVRLRTSCLCVLGVGRDCPLLNGFIGEFFWFLSGAFSKREPIYGILGATGVIWERRLTFCGLYQRVFFWCREARRGIRRLPDLNLRGRKKLLFFLPAAAMALVMGRGSDLVAQFD